MRYTINGAAPTSTSGTLIGSSSGSVRLTPSPGGTTLQVIAFEPGMNDSAVNLGTYYYESGDGAAVNGSTSNSAASMPYPGDGGPSGGPGGGPISQDGQNQSISYDGNGNLMNYKAWVYRYDAQNRLTYASNGTTSAQFYYDGRNRQIARNINGVIRFNAWDNWELVEEYSSSLNVVTGYLQGATGVIKSWDNRKWGYPVIIDNMMNLELLFWATRVTGDSSFYKIAVTHANTTMKNHFRPDYSSYHVLNYNAENGEVKQKKTAQGFADESAWARGQAWALYGFTVMYRETKEKKYLDQANHIAHFILSHPNLPADKIPYWDFNAPNIPNALRDASAAAVMASALIELSSYSSAAQSKECMQTVETILKSLSSAQYKAPAGANGGFITEHCVGHLPAKSEVDVPLTYADYYFVEAMKRYKALAK